MSDVSLVLNVLWIVCGGLWMAAAWLIAAVIMAITIVGLPWARDAITIASYTLLPFGQQVVSRAAVTGRDDIGTGLLSMIGNLIWLIFAGWWLALAHVITAFFLAITIINRLVASGKRAGLLGCEKCCRRRAAYDYGSLLGVHAVVRAMVALVALIDKVASLHHLTLRRSL
jgi:uncharacterized membrane protein YccF (DUF307 family)